MTKFQHRWWVKHWPVRTKICLLDVSTVAPNHKLQVTTFAFNQLMDTCRRRHTSSNRLYRETDLSGTLYWNCFIRSDCIVHLLKNRMKRGKKGGKKRRRRKQFNTSLCPTENEVSIHTPLSKSATSWSPSLTRSSGVWPSRFFLLASAPCWKSNRLF